MAETFFGLVSLVSTPAVAHASSLHPRVEPPRVAVVASSDVDVGFSKAIDEKRSSDAYLVSYKDYTNTIPDDSVIITLSDLYINRGNLFKLIGNKLEACEDYNRALMLIDNVGEIDQLTYNKEDINHLILENCN